MVERGRYLDESLEESFLGWRRMKPDFLPCFVSFEKIAGVKESDAVRKKVRMSMRWRALGYCGGCHGGYRKVFRFAIGSRTR